MLWLKAWFETRWRIAMTIVLGALILLNATAIKSAHINGLPALLNLTAFVCFLVPILLAGSGIQTTSGSWSLARGVEESTLFTLSLPVTRFRLFAVRAVAGILETLLLLALFFFLMLWLLAPSLSLSAADAAGQLATAASCSLAVYGVSTCLSTFMNEAWRLRASVIAIALLFVLVRLLPPWANIFQQLTQRSPLMTHQIPWATIGVGVGLAVLFFGGSLKIVQLRDY